MKEDELKTSWKQRLGIAIIAAILLGSSVAVYVSIVLSGANSSAANTKAEEQIAKLEEEYNSKYSEYTAAATELNSKYFDTFKSYRSRVSSFNSGSANTDAVTSKDLKVGDGEEISSESTGYGAYYLGWCADETVFDSSFDNFESPTALNAPLIVEEGAMIAGWYDGVDGMKLGGVREVTIPSTYAYGSSDVEDESQVPCGSKDAALKFVIMPVALSEDFKSLAAELSSIYTELMYAYYGMQQ